MDTTIFETPPIDVSSNSLERHILQQLEEEAVINLDALMHMLPAYSWNQIFNAVDHLARARRILLRRHDSEYTLSSITHAV